MSNYIKIPMEDGTTLTTGALAASTITGGGTITGYTARNGITVYTSTGEGSGATVDVTMGDRKLDNTSAVLMDGANYTDDFVDTAATEAGLLSPGGAEFTITADGAGNLSIDAITIGGAYEVGDTLTINVPTSGVGINQTGAPGVITLTPLIADSDLKAPLIANLVFTIVDGGESYANGDELFIDIADPSGTEVAWDAMISITVAGLTGYDDGPYVLLPVGNVLCTIPNPMAGSDAVINYADAQVGGAIKAATITFSGITTAEERLEITQALNVAILHANQAENSQPTLVLPDGVRGLEVDYA